MKKIIAILLSLLFTACTQVQEPLNRYSTTVQLDRDKGVFISIPKNGFHDNREYIHSAKMTVDALKEAFTQYTNTIKITDNCQAKECFPWIKSEKYPYYILPEILHWEEGVTELSDKKPDRVEIKLSIYESSSRKILASIVLTEETHIDNVDAFHPQDLLPRPIGQYLEALYYEQSEDK